MYDWECDLGNYHSAGGRSDDNFQYHTQSSGREF